MPRLDPELNIDAKTAVAAIAFVAGFGFMATLPFIADYVVIVGGLVGLVFAVRERNGVLVQLPSVMLHIGLALLAVTLPFVYRSEQDLLPVLACLPLLAAPGLAALVGRRSFLVGPHFVPMLCLLGVGVAAALGGIEAVVAGSGRAGLGNNPIHYGGIATVLGYLALMGFLTSKAVWRGIYLAGPALALVCVVLSGSRGPLLAWGVLAVVNLPILTLGIRHRVFAALILIFALAGFVLFAVLGRETLVMQRILGAWAHLQTSGDGRFNLTELLVSQDVYRTALYDTGWKALMSSPVVGIGFGQIMPLARDLYPDLLTMQSLENLHSDLADFAAMAGLVGVVSLGLFLLSPFAIFRGASRHDMTLWLGAIVLSVGFATLGLTNAMFGVLPQTCLFAVGLAYLIALSRSQTAAEEAPTELRR